MRGTKKRVTNSGKSRSIKDFSCGEISRLENEDSRRLYAHQEEAMYNLSKINKKREFSTLVVLPTGGGKTYTLTRWLLKNAINRKKKILWIAHRQMLLDQALKSFKDSAYKDVITEVPSFSFRIISGSSSHGRTNDIKNTDDLLIISKDSLGRQMQSLDSWLEGEKEVYLVIDEAHHSIAKTYRRVIDHVKKKVGYVKLIGITATPFRTAQNEQGKLGKIYSDGIKGGKPVNNGIAYQIGLKDLINRQILSRPFFENYFTDENYGSSLGLKALDSIQHFDQLPPPLAIDIAKNAARNKLIVDTYKYSQEKYGQTIVFAVNQWHAIELSKLFNKNEIKAGYVISGTKDCVTGVSIDPKENELKIEAFKEGKLQVLVNVNILTEGIDLPKTKTVFLTRPTVSPILMTQMVGRALRGERAGGTKEAHIVSFIDNWEGRIAWVNPDSLFNDESDFTDDPKERVRREIRLISISKIEEFVSLLDDKLDTSKLEKVPFDKRIPVGMYSFAYSEEKGNDLDSYHQVMVYNSTSDAYQKLMAYLPRLFDKFGVGDKEFLSEEELRKMEKECKKFFDEEMVPPYAEEDVFNILKFYAQNETSPQFYSFDEIDRNKLDVAKIAKTIVTNNMSEKEKATYLKKKWESKDDDILRLLFTRELYFLNQVNIELMKISFPELYAEETKGNIKYGTKQLEDLPLHEIGKINPELEEDLREHAFSKATKNGLIKCALCGRTSKNKRIFQVDHITPMNKGGKSVYENLQILCKWCNGKKGDK